MVCRTAYGQVDHARRRPRGQPDLALEPDAVVRDGLLAVCQLDIAVHQDQALVLRVDLRLRCDLQAHGLNAVTPLQLEVLHAPGGQLEDHEHAALPCCRRRADPCSGFARARLPSSEGPLPSFRGACQHHRLSLTAGARGQVLGAFFCPALLEYINTR